VLVWGIAIVFAAMPWVMGEYGAADVRVHTHTHTVLAADDY
jgi:hypothetical protein